MREIQAMAVHEFPEDCECLHCMEFNPSNGTRFRWTGKVRFFNRRASSARSIRYAFGFSNSESYDIIERSPDVQAFFADALSAGFTEQVYPYPCCSKCELCRDAVRARRKTHFRRQAALFIELLYARRFRVTMMTLTMPAVCPRPEHLADFHNAEARAAVRAAWVDDRVDRRLENVLKTLSKYSAQLPYGRQLDDGSFEVTWDESELVRRWTKDSPRLRVRLARLIASEDNLRVRDEELDARLRQLEQAGMEDSTEFRDLLSRADIIARELSVTIPSATRLLKRFLRSDIEAELAVDDRPIFARWCIHAWQRGWLQSVYGPGECKRHKVHNCQRASCYKPTVFIPRVKRGRGFSYEASVIDGKVSPYLHARWHRRHGDILPRELEDEVFRAPRELVVHLFQGFKKRLKQDGYPLDYLGVEELGSPEPNSVSGSHFHLHLLIGIASDVNLNHFRKYVQRVWHMQCGNVYWGKHDANGEPIDFCSPLRHKAKTVNYIANYFSKSHEPGHIRKSQGLGLNRALLEQRVIDLLPRFADRVEPVFGLNERGRPTVIPRLSDGELESVTFEEWVGIDFEERPIGREPIAAHRLQSTPAVSIHKAAGVKSFEDVVPFAVWVPAHVWDARGSPDSPASQRICDASETFGWMLS